MVDNNYLPQDAVKSLAKLPSREVLLAQVVGTIAAPLTSFVGVLNERIRSFLGVLQAIADKKKESSN